MVLGTFPTELLGLDLLKGRSWANEERKIWAFRKETQYLFLLSSAPALPPSLLTNVKPYLLLLRDSEGITPVIGVLKERE